MGVDMSSRSKAMLIGISVLGIVCVSGVYLRLKQKTGGKSSVITIQMRDDSALSPTYFVSAPLHCRIRMPTGMLLSDSGRAKGRDPGILGDFEAAQPDGSLGALLVQRGGIPFNDFVRRNTAGLMADAGSTKRHIIEEGPCKLAGREAYSITTEHQSRDLDQQLTQRFVVVNAEDDRVYILISTVPSSAWKGNAKTWESSFSTFEVGDFPQ
jgi:hypothetical protein